MYQFFENSDGCGSIFDKKTKKKIFYDNDFKELGLLDENMFKIY